MKRYNQQTGVSSLKSGDIVRIPDLVPSDTFISMSTGKQTHFTELMQNTTKGSMKWLRKFNNIEDAKERAAVTVQVAILAAGQAKFTEVKTFMRPLPEAKRLDVDGIANGSPEEIVDELLDGVGMKKMLSVAKSIYSDKE